MSGIIEVKNLTKSYGKVCAVRGISFGVEKGTLLAFLGPNGAGKSTTISILCTLLKNDGGEAVIDGYALGERDAKIRTSIGVVFQENMLDPLLTVKENLLIRGGFYGAAKSALANMYETAARAADIHEFASRPYGKLSGGQKRRADIARALIHRPRVLFLDEPTTGLDPQTRRSIWETIRRLQTEHEMTVFLTTHYMEEAAGADRVIVIDDGQIAARGTPSELRRAYSSDVLRMQTDEIAALRQALDGMGVSYDASGGAVTVKLRSTVDSIEILTRCKALITNVEVQNGTMDDAFIGITGKEIRE